MHEYIKQTVTVAVFLYMIFPDSSVVERSAVNADVPGSNPGLGAKIFEKNLP